MAIKILKLSSGAKEPEVAHPRFDLGYDLFALDDVTIKHDEQAKVRTGIAVEFENMAVGFIIKDRSSMASKRIYTHGGVIDAGYRGEILVLLENRSGSPYEIKAGDKIAQMIPLPTLTFTPIKVVDKLEVSERGDGGFGSTDKKRIVTI